MKKIFLTTVSILTLTFPVNSQILYKIEGKNGTSPSYIFGSHHLSPIDIVEKSDAEIYFDETAQVIGEIDLTQDPMSISLAVQPHMMAPADSTLSVLLADKDFDALNEQFEKWSPMPGISLKMLDNLKPMAVSTMLSVGISLQVYPGFDPEQQLDSYFFKRGVKDAKNIVALETPDFQGEVLFDKTPIAYQAEMLVEMLENPEETVENARKLMNAYQNRDLEIMVDMSKENDSHPEFMEYILFQRNADWLTKIPDLINNDASFIVVGALHLPGEKGILQGLRNLGYTITPLY